MSDDLLTSLAPAAAVAVLVLAGVAAVVWPLLIVTKRKLAEAMADRERLSRQAELAREVLGLAPDGLYLFNRLTGAESASPAVLELFGIGLGDQATMADLKQRLPVDAARLLSDAVGQLEQRGEAFDIALTTSDTKAFRAIGARAHGRDGTVLADLIWFRPLAGEMTPSLDRHLPAVLDALPIPVWLRDARLSVVFSNKACGEGAPVSEAALTLAAKAMSDGETHGESHVMTFGGETRPVAVSETPVEGWQGTVGLALGEGEALAPAGLDSSPPQSQSQPQPQPQPKGDIPLAVPLAPVLEGEAETAVAEASAFDNLSSAIAVFGPDRRLVYANRSFADIWGIDVDWLNRLPLLEDVLDRLRGERRLPEVADFRRFREEHRNRFGRLSHAITEVLHLPDGRALRQILTPTTKGGIVYAYEDLSERLGLEREFTELHRVQLETLDNLFESIAVFGSDGRLKLCNPPFLALWGLDGAEVEAGLHVSDFVEATRPYWQVTDAEWPDVRDIMAAQILDREGISERLGRQDGVVLDAAVVPLPDGASLLSYLDVTDSAEVEQALRDRADALDEASRLKADFIANVSFETRTPLTSVRGYAEALDQEYFGPLNPRQKDYAGGIVKAADQLQKVLGDILDLAAIEAGTMALDLETVDLHELLVSVLGLVRERARSKQLKLEFDCPADIGWVVVDPKRLKQVLLNLLSNAIDFSPERRMVGLVAARADDSVTLKVIDTGLGMPGSRQGADTERLMEPFERGPDSEGDGVGLGLALVKRFVDLHGGDVGIKTQANRGTTVTVSLPVIDHVGPEGS
ncbi:MAG: ATP-binding protein [Magnetovibrionaceae bacterium]